MDRSVALLYLIGLGRSRVSTCHSRDIGCFRSRVIFGYSRDISIYISVHELLYSRWNEWKFETGWEMMMRCRYGNKTEFLGVLAPFVLIKDRTVVGSADRGLNSTNHMPGVGGSRNR